MNSFVFKQEEQFMTYLMLPSGFSLAVVLINFEGVLELILMITLALIFLFILTILSRRKSKLTITTNSLLINSRTLLNDDIMLIRLYIKKGKIMIIRDYLFKWNILNPIAEHKVHALIDIEEWAVNNGVKVEKR